MGELKSSAHLQTRVGIATGIVVVGDRPPNASELAINFKRRELEETCRKLDGLIEAIAVFSQALSGVLVRHAFISAAL